MPTRLTGSWTTGARAVPAAWLTAAVAGFVVYAAYDGGTFDLASRNALAIAVWWVILVAVGLGIWPAEPLTAGALAPAGLLGLFAAWQLASTWWSASAEAVFAEFDLTLLYLGMYLLVVLAGRRHDLRRWLDGIALGIAAVAGIALISRLVPDAFGRSSLVTAIPNAVTRLSFPLGYWNGLGLLVGIGFPLALCAAADADRRRSTPAAALLPLLGAVPYLASSRGALVAAAVGSLIFVLGAARRWAALGLALLAGCATAAAVGVLRIWPVLVDGPLGSPASRAAGWRAALALLAVSALAAGARLASPLVVNRLSPPRPAVRRGAVLVAVGVLCAALLAAHPLSRFEHFTTVPQAQGAGADAGTVGGHLASVSGNGRWQFWQAAIDEFRSSPLHGGGAGSYEQWWARHASFPYFIRDAHSLYLETLGELGVVGLLLLLSAVGAAVAVGVRRVAHGAGSERTRMAALLGALAVYLIGAGIDWMWELPAVTLVGVACLGLLGGPGGRVGAVRLREAASRRGGLRRFPIVLGIAVAAWAVICSEAIPLLADVEVRKSQSYVRAGEGKAAASAAVSASKIQPWAATPYLQLALVEESRGALAAAERAIGSAIRRDRGDWRLWLVAARIQTRRGNPAAGLRSLRHAEMLNPRSPLFAGRPR